MRYKFPNKKNLKDIKRFFLNKKLAILYQNKKKNVIQPNYLDLYNLYNYVVKNKRTTILEFGSGWSSLIFILALNELKRKFYNESKNLRRGNPFELFILENNKKYLNITKKRINNFFIKNNIKNICKINYIISDVKMVEFGGRYVTEYKKIPICNPDFIYLDGPDQKNIKSDLVNFTTNHIDLMPMVSDILKFEYFLIPGTIIISDGRAANVKFLRDFFRRNWIYKYDKKSDQHFFFLNDKSLGKHNDKLLKFYNK